MILRVENLKRKAVFAIVVTYNRCLLLEKCLQALLQQTALLSGIVLIDNASTDGTEAWLRQSGMLDHSSITYVRMNENTGGAGGFYEGIRQALEAGADWLWMMDDDAEPATDALHELMRIAVNPSNVYGSLAIQGEDTAWATTLLKPAKRVVHKVVDVPEASCVQSLPFLGFMIHRNLVERIGLPDVGYFIAADDVEYCMRAEQAGAEIVVAGQSRISHPKSERYTVNIFGRSLVCLRLPPWKRYYDTRNRLLIAKKYYGYAWLTKTIPGSFVRLFSALCYERHRAAQLWAFTAGFIDGVLGMKGRRHQLWRIPF